MQVKPLTFPDFSCLLKKKSEFHFVIVILHLIFKYVHICYVMFMYLRINNNRQQKSVLLIVHNS